MSLLIRRWFVRPLTRIAQSHPEANTINTFSLALLMIAGFSVIGSIFLTFLWLILLSWDRSEDLPGAGMKRYSALVDAVYQASQKRRGERGWHGKLVVHTHVGEGGIVDQFQGVTPPAFSMFPPVQLTSCARRCTWRSPTET